MKKKIGAMLALLLFAHGLFAELPPAFRGLWSEADSALLETKGEVSAVLKENGRLKLLPRLIPAGRIEEAVAVMKPMFGVELVLLHRAPGKKLDNSAELKRICNTFLSVSSLTNLQYYSESRKTMRVLFVEAFRVEGPDKRNRLPDLSVQETIPPFMHIFTFQNDSSFGENFYEVEYRHEQGCFLMTMKNASKIWYGILPIVDPGNLVYFILVAPAGEYLLFYSLICVKGANPFGILESRTASFYNRIKALDGWFLKRSGLF